MKVVNSGSGLEKRFSGGIRPCEDLQCQAEGNPAQRLGGRVVRLCAVHAAKQRRRRWWAGVQGTEACRALGLCQGCGQKYSGPVLNVTAVPCVACSFQADNELLEKTIYFFSFRTWAMVWILDVP